MLARTPLQHLNIELMKLFGYVILCFTMTHRHSLLTKVVDLLIE